MNGDEDSSDPECKMLSSLSKSLASIHPEKIAFINQKLRNTITGDIRIQTEKNVIKKTMIDILKI